MTFDTLTHFLILAQEQEGAEPPPGGGFGIFPFLILLFVMMYFLTIRPQRKKQKELQAQVSAMRSGDKVVTAGGIHGLVTNIKDRTVVLKVADNVKMEFEKSSVANVIKKERPAEEDAGEEEESEEAESTT